MDRQAELPGLSEAQLEVMHVLWERPEATLGEIWSELSRKRQLAKNTVQTLLTRLVEKGWVKYRQEGKSFLYTSAQGRGTARRQILKKVLDAAFQGSTEGLVMTLLEDKGISQDEADRLHRLIDEAERAEK